MARTMNSRMSLLQLHSMLQVDGKISLKGFQSTVLCSREINQFFFICYFINSSNTNVIFLFKNKFSIIFIQYSTAAYSYHFGGANCNKNI